jgi:cobyrinic acid a,c-diamide synthase
MDAPRLVIAAPASGHGKTTLATGLLAAFAARGIRVAGFKVGPDYIDPGYHALACGRPSRNLDPVLVGTGLIGPLFAHGAAGAQLSIVEGVMGLYDGRVGGGDHGSTAEVARLLAAPVVLVVDVSGQGRSVAALVHGFRSFSPGVRLAGVILNRVGSPRHEQILREALEEVGTPVFGALRRSDAVATPSRHLGLVPVVERSEAARESVAALAALVESTVDLEAVMSAARGAPPLAASPWSPSPAAGLATVTGRPVVAVAGGPAFSFGYTETVELLAAAGADVSIVDPLRDEVLPAGTRALVVGGGFPEVYAEQLSANVALRGAVAALAGSGAPIAAECAGLLWLCRSLEGAPMCGVIDAEATMTERLTLGYRDAVALSGSWLGPAGTRVTGHEFHRTVVSPRAGAQPAWRWAGGTLGRGAAPNVAGPGAPDATEGFVQARVHASYLHLHWAGRPEIAHRLVSVAAALESSAPVATAASAGTAGTVATAATEGTAASGESVAEVAACG